MADDVTAEEAFQVASKVVSKAVESGKPLFRETFIQETKDWFGDDVAEQIAKRIYG